MQFSFQKLKNILVTSKALAFPWFDLDFHLAVDTISKRIGYMLYQILDNGLPRVIKFGSKGLSQWQQSYGPTKLELLGLVTSVLDCAPYLCGCHFVAECGHQALNPLFQMQLKGAFYEQWLAILQQFNMDIVYKSASQMVIPDAFPCTQTFQELLTSSPEDTHDLRFPYVSEKSTQIKLISPSNDEYCTLH